MIPNFQRKGDKLKASWCNDVVSSLRGNAKTIDDIGGSAKKLYKPFDVINLDYVTNKWYIKLREAVLFEWGTNLPFSIKAPSNDPLSSYPTIEVIPNKDLYYNWKEKKLIWDDKDITGNLKVLEFHTLSADAFKIRNVHPEDIDINEYPPFYPLLSKLDDDYHIAITPGFVCERVPSETGGAIINHLPHNILDESDKLIHQAIVVDEQVSIRVKTNESGLIEATTGEAVESYIGTEDEESTHYIPKCADNQTGQKGTFYFKIAALNEDKLVLGLAGSHIDYYRSSILENTINPDSAGMGRIIKEYNIDDNTYFIRVLKENDYGQISITENASDLTIGGNGLSGKLVLQYEENSPVDLATWQDGLHTLEADEIIKVPKYVAGDGISITGPVSNTYTVSSTSTSLSGYTGTIYIVDVCATFTHVMVYEDGLLTDYSQVSI